MAKLPSGQFELPILKPASELVNMNPKPTYIGFTDESGKNYYFNAPNEVQGDLMKKALEAQGYKTTTPQYYASPMAATESDLAYQKSIPGFNWNDPENVAWRQEYSKAHNSNFIDFSTYEDVTGRLVPKYIGQQTTQGEPQANVDFWKGVNAGQPAVSPSNQVQYQKNPTTGQVEPTAYGKPGAVATPQQPVQPATQPIGQTYTVLPGDTLSTIAQRMGTTPDKISGYRSGNPNLIYPGEVLSVNGGVQGGTQGTTGQTGQAGQDIPTQIKEVQTQIADLTQQLNNAQTAGYTEGGTNAGKDIPLSVLEGKGITIDPDKAVTNPTGSWQETYQSLFTSLGLDKVKDQITSTIAKVQAMDDQMAEEIADTNENPWISEGARQKKIQSIQSKYDMKKAGLNSALTLMQGIYDDGRQEAQFLVSTALSQYNSDRTFDMNETKMLADQAEAQIAAKKDTQVVEVNGRKVLVDTQTGEKIADLGASEVSGTGTGTGDGTIKPPTAGQYQVATYADRIKQAEDIFTKLEPYVAGLNTITLKTQQLLPNALRNENYQLLEQAQRNFINAVLRRESGAAISLSEFESANKQYFPQPGDGKAVLEQKKANRQTVLAGFIRESGSAYTSPQSGGGDNLTDEQAWELYQLTQ